MINKVKIGARIYTITYIDNDHILKNNKNIYSYIDYDNCNIVIRNNVNDIFQEENLIHELLHAICEVANIDIIIKHTETEKIISLLTPFFHKFIIDNIDLLKLISDKTTRENEENDN
tara:strand:+ start:6236 stop:6586 length:351 start_codon:yes stop_codon:yes gene_type:complete